MKSRPIFKDKTKLSPHYVPERLVDREDEFRELVRLFKPVLRSRAVQRAFIVGPRGSGRTALVSVFARELEAFAREEGLRLDRAYVDCRWRRTPWQVLGEPFRLYAPRKTRKGLATAELLDEIYRRASSEGSRLVMILDDLDPFIEWNGPDLLYSLSRVEDGSDRPGLLNLIGVVDDLDVLNRLDEATRSSVLHNFVVLDRYERRQLRRILEDRTEVALRPGAVGEGVLDFISRKASESGDAGHAILILREAGEVSAQEGAERILREHARRAAAGAHSGIPLEDLERLSDHETLLLMALARYRWGSGVSPLTGELRKCYENVCKERGRRPRKSTQFYRYLEELSGCGLIETTPFNGGHRGRSRVIDLAVSNYDRIWEVLEGALD